MSWKKLENGLLENEEAFEYMKDGRLHVVPAGIVRTEAEVEALSSSEMLPKASSSVDQEEA